VIPPEAQDLREAVLAALQEGVDASWPAERFDALALLLFIYQYRFNLPYHRFCEATGVTLKGVTDWRAIPALPTSAFKAAPICSFPPEEAGIVYRTSGTTRRADRGEHRLRDTRLYDAALAPNLKAHLLPDVATMRMAVLAPSPQEAPDSSLSHMLGRAVETWGAPGSRFYVAGQELALDALEEDLARCERAGQPVCLLGTAFAFVRFLDHCAARRRAYRLPDGSRLMDTGGYKGRSREVPKEELYRAYEERLGIPPYRIVNEYGMTEMSSQFYDTVLRDHLAGRPRRRQKVPPPWVRTLVVDPETVAPLPPGTPGLLRHYDLANVDSVLALQTEDLGLWLDEGFEILGRLPGADPRGCSLSAEELGQIA
jgi:hypothetical protein